MRINLTGLSLNFLEEWFNTGHNSQQIPNLLFSFLILFLLKKTRFF